MLGDLEKVSWVVLKSGYSINPYCDLENALYGLKMIILTKRLTGFQLMAKNIKCFTRKKKNSDESRFIDGDISEIHDFLNSDCNTINEFLIQYYVFDYKNE